MVKVMEHDLLLKGKYTFRAHGRKFVMVKKTIESVRHVVMKAMLWALYLPTYPHIQVEVPIGYKYKPDLVQIESERPMFWAEAGRVSSQKLHRLLYRFPHTHFAFTIWASPLVSIEVRIKPKTRKIRRTAPIDLISIPRDVTDRFIDPKRLLGTGFFC